MTLYENHQQNVIVVFDILQSGMNILFGSEEMLKGEEIRARHERVPRYFYKQALYHPTSHHDNSPQMTVSIQLHCFDDFSSKLQSHLY